jgi:hypothetical protein
MDSMPPATTISDQLVGHGDRVDAGEADLVDRDRRDVHRHPTRHGGRAGGILAGARLDDLAHDHVVDLVTGDTGLLQGALDRHSPEVGGGLVLQAAQQATDRGTSPGHDHGCAIAC